MGLKSGYVLSLVSRLVTFVSLPALYLVVERGGCPAGPVAGVGPPVGSHGVQGGGAVLDVVVDDGQRPVEGHHAKVADVRGVVGHGRGGGGPAHGKNKNKLCSETCGRELEKKQEHLIDSEIKIQLN